MTPPDLGDFTIRQAGDPAGTGLELACIPCDMRLCGVDAGDTLAVLTEVARDHAERQHRW
ncbi:MAG: hypothetical protein M0030_11485 [Actinomycetota bacterium]|nr:hypothetical protein [Actinomycetota bacterium]